MHKQQYSLMLQNDVAGMDALEKQYKQAEQAIATLKTQMGQAMGIGSERKGNQLLGGGVPNDPVEANTKPGMRITDSRPQFAANDTPAHVTGLNGTEEKGVTSSGGGYADFFKEQREEYRADQLKKLLTDLNRDMGRMNDEELTNKYSEFGIQSQSEALKKNGEWSSELKNLIGEDALVKFWKDMGVPMLTSVQGPMWVQAPSLLDQEKGMATINGKDIPIVVSGFDSYEDFSGITKEKLSLSFDRRDFWEMISQMNMAGEKNEEKTQKYNPEQVAAASAAAVISAAQSMIDTKRHFDINVNTVNIEGEERTLITYSENRLNLAAIFGIGFSSMTKKQSGINYWVDGNYQFIDDKHLESPTGYLYVEDGKMMVKPIYFSEDKIVRDGKDITHSFFQPVELDSDAVILIDAKLKEQGIDLGLNLNAYDKEQ